ncbi:MAG TPA: hypothetical protein DGR27_05425 [Eubacterium sp.]|nr:MAG TPA: hypothetical protein [Caudoviricetes sp.]HAS70562.1 hypothetical protein [Eubacterium sp.]HCW37941.1 hypothetical protein [Eubacterium sp.]
MLSSVEIIDIQNTIIKMQSEVIYDLFGQLKQYMTVEELDNSQVVMKINAAAKLRSEIGGI